MQIRTLAIFGVTSQTGETLARAAVNRGWAVRGFARRDSTVPAVPGSFSIVRGDFTEEARVAETVAATDAVCCVIGPRPPYTEAFCAPATKAIIRAMQEGGVRRLVCQTGAMVGTGRRTLFFEYLARSFARRQPAVAQDRVEQERLVQDSGLDWTLVKPPRLVEGTTHCPMTVESALRIGLLSKIGRADVATFMLDIIEQEKYIGARVFVRA
jgi:putative NADH-flavin reductase